MVRRRWRGARKFGWLLAAIVLLAGLLAGCSSSSDNDSAADMAVSKTVNEQAAVGEAAPGAQANQASAAEQPSAADDTLKSVQFSKAVPASGQEGDGQSSDFGAGIGAVADADAGFNRKMIYSASVVLKAKSFSEAEEKVSNAIFQSKGFIVQFSDIRSEDQIGSTYTIKVPSSGFSSFLGLLKAIPSEQFERKVEGNDVTEEYVDLDARLKAKQAVESRLLAFMDKATKSDDLVKFSNELGNVQQEIEQIKGRMRYLDQNVAYSTVTLKLYQAGSDTNETNEEEPESRSLGEKLGDAMSGSLDVLKQIGEGLLTFAAALLPVLAVLVIVGLPIAWGVRKSRETRKRQAALNRSRWNENPAPGDSNAGATLDGSNEEPTPDGSFGGPESGRSNAGPAPDGSNEAFMSGGSAEEKHKSSPPADPEIKRENE